ncbi:MAG: allophanate hydrolase subunit 1 [Gemmataceae bacterium]|nr:allophanate hydrolase subunit 1 [Gemmataceae bacterium]
MPVRVEPLGDQAVLVYLADEPAAVRFAAAVRAAAPPWLQDVVPAYASVGVFFDADLVGVDEVVQGRQPLVHEIPVCYDLGPDLGLVAARLGRPAAEVVRRHTGTEYTVYAVGFMPGFPYLGYLPPELCGVPRLASPRLRVEPGSVGVTGRQTAVYPLARPGGWHLIGRTPLVLVDVADGFFPLRVGDRVRFTRIGEAEFRRREGERPSS